MTAPVLSENVIPGLPSASGIEIIGNTAYVIGDDSPWLYLLDAATLAPMRRVPLLAGANAGPDAGRLPKLDKPDLECLAACTWPDGRPGTFQ